MVALQVESGKFSDASQVVSEGLRALETRDEIERLRVAQLRALVAASEADFAQGRFTTVSTQEEHKSLMAEILREAKQKRGL